jgi:hypothetical protein
MGRERMMDDGEEPGQGTLVPDIDAESLNVF